MTRFASLIALALLSLAAGCASAPSATVIQVGDVKSLSGRWLGYATGTAAGAPNPIELTISPDGTYTSRIGAQLQHGTVSVTDGKIAFARQGASAGSATVFAASTAVLEDRGGKRVLVGQGRSDFGPYSYEFTEQK